MTEETTPKNKGIKIFNDLSDYMINHPHAIIWVPFLIGLLGTAALVVTSIVAIKTLPIIFSCPIFKLIYEHFWDIIAFGIACVAIWFFGVLFFVAFTADELTPEEKKKKDKEGGK